MCPLADAPAGRAHRMPASQSAPLARATHMPERTLWDQNLSSSIIHAARPRGP
jgi:hypothetical protein